MNRDESSTAARLDQALAEYVRRVESGGPVDHAALFAEFSDVADQLRGCLGVISTLDDFFPAKAALRDQLSDTRKLTIADSEAPTPVDAVIPVNGRSVASATGTRPRKFGDYELLEEIARGGMGVVYKARQVSLNRIVALKMILTGQWANPEEVHRFHAEAEAAARLDHPGIVPIFETGEHNGQSYFSMGYVEGTSLAKKIAAGPLPPGEAALLIQQATEAVQYAHEQGVIHRDLKPANVLLDRDSHPRVTDFGLAKSVHADSQLTASGQVIGTPSFMPPEQAAARLDQISPLSDVYSLGAILYFLLTGRPPFQAASPMETLRQVLEQEPVGIRQLNPGVPRDLETIALRCLDKNPARRCGAARELADELRRYLAGEPIRSRPTSGLERGAK